MKYIYVVAERSPYRSFVCEAGSGDVKCAFTGGKILELMGDTAILNEMYEILIRDGEIKPGDILAPERP